MTAETATQPEDDLAEILQTTTRTLTIDGVVCKVRRLRNREFFALLRVLTKALGPGVAAIFARPAEDIPEAIAGALGIAIPEADEQWLIFCKQMVEPADQSEDAEKTVAMAWRNPELETTFEFVTILMEQEADNFVKLGKVAGLWWETNKAKLTRKAVG